MEVCGCFWECSTEGGRCFWGSFRDDGKKNQTYIFFSVQVYGRGCVIKVTVSRWNHPLHLQRWSWRPVSSLVVGILHSSPGPLGTRGLGPRLSPLFPVMLNWRLYSAITRIVMVSCYGNTLAWLSSEKSFYLVSDGSERSCKNIPNNLIQYIHLLYKGFLQQWLILAAGVSNDFKVL